MTDPLITIILRSYNEGWALAETFAALKSQTYTRWELIVVDSGSTDGSVDLIRSAAPRRFIQLSPADYIPGRVLNDGIRFAAGDPCLFLNADATPHNRNWLRPLVEALLNPRHAAAFSRQLPRPDCRAVFASDYERCFGPRRASARWDHFFSMVSSGIRKDVWSQRGFLENVQYAEDDEYTRWCRRRGYEVVFCPDSVVMHSHNYSRQEAYKRSFGDARTMALHEGFDPAHTKWWRTCLIGCANDLRYDLAFCLRHARVHELPHAAQIRWHQRRGKLHGYRAGLAQAQRSQ